MTIYLDSEFKCHLANPDDEWFAVETDFFNGKCNEYIEGYRYVPEGAFWRRDDGTIFKGLMVAPWKNYAELEAAQRAYEQAQATSITLDLLAEHEERICMLEIFAE